MGQGSQKRKFCAGSDVPREKGKGESGRVFYYAEKVFGTWNGKIYYHVQGTQLTGTFEGASKGEKLWGSGGEYLS